MSTCCTPSFYQFLLFSCSCWAPAAVFPFTTSAQLTSLHTGTFPNPTVLFAFSPTKALIINFEIRLQDSHVSRIWHHVEEESYLHCLFVRTRKSIVDCSVTSSKARIDIIYPWSKVCWLCWVAKKSSNNVLTVCNSLPIVTLNLLMLLTVNLASIFTLQQNLAFLFWWRHVTCSLIYVYIWGTWTI